MEFKSPVLFRYCRVSPQSLCLIFLCCQQNSFLVWAPSRHGDKPFEGKSPQKSIFSEVIVCQRWVGDWSKQLRAGREKPGHETTGFPNQPTYNGAHATPALKPALLRKNGRGALLCPLTRVCCSGFVSSYGLWAVSYGPRPNKCDLVHIQGRERPPAHACCMNRDCES